MAIQVIQAGTAQDVPAPQRLHGAVPVRLTANRTDIHEEYLKRPSHSHMTLEAINRFGKQYGRAEQREEDGKGDDQPNDEGVQCLQ